MHRASLLAAAVVALLLLPTGATGKEAHYYTIQLTNASVGQASGATGQDGKIPITSFLWGTKHTGASSGMAMKGSKIGENAAIGQAIGSMATEGNEDSAQATGKRQHKPMLMRGHYDSSAPPPRGTLTVLAGGGTCRVGARYPSLRLSGGGKTYLLQGVTVTSCGGASAAASDSVPTEEVSFAYQSIKFTY
jgi:type VI protein secretion system component Hcp